jgi:hypothetical protein
LSPGHPEISCFATPSDVAVLLAFLRDFLSGFFKKLMREICAIFPQLQFTPRCGACAVFEKNGILNTNFSFVLSECLMATFVVRVQLQGAPTAAEQRVLNESMRHAAYKQTMDGSRSVQLPEAMYIKMSTALSCELVRDEVKKIVKQTYPGNQFALMVVEIKNWASYGLKSVE